MSSELLVLLSSAAGIACVHTILGPDHYVPFVAMSRAHGWSLRRTLWITTFCGIGHVLGSVILGAVGIAAGITLRHLEIFESTRGEVAGWLLMAFGLVYLAWSLIRLLRGRRHVHAHRHADGTLHAHDHGHDGDHAHAHTKRGGSLVPWSLFVIFVLGPCEPLIPLLMFPAATLGTGAVVLVAAVFAVITVATMLVAVAASCLGLRATLAHRLERWGQPAAGALVFLCGAAIQLGL